MNNKKKLLYAGGLLLVLGLLALLAVTTASSQETQADTQQASEDTALAQQTSDMAMPVLTAGNPVGEFVPGQVIVLFRKGITEDWINKTIKSQNTTVLKISHELNIYLLQLPDGVSPPEAAQRYRVLPEVLAADPNFVVSAATYPNDPLFSQQWYFDNTGNNPGNNPGNLGFIDADISAPQGWSVSKGASSIKIAILDTGVGVASSSLPPHPDLNNPPKVVACKNFSSPSPSPNCDDLYDHGTHVAGLAAADTNNNLDIAGTCPNCLLLNAKVLDDNGVGNVMDLESGIAWSVSHGAKILSMSLASAPGNPCPSTLQNVITTAVQMNNVIFVAAAGNNGVNLTIHPVWPAVCKNVVAVAATDARDDNSWLAGFSNYGAPIVDIAAPGVDVLSLRTPALGGGVERKSGTSMAAPIVSGALGVIWAHFPYFTNTMVINRMLKNADKIDGTVGYPGYATNINSWQYGRLNLCRALGAQPCDPPNPKPIIVSAPACPPGGGVVTLDLSTGTTNGIADPFGTQDSKWRIIQVPSSTHGQLPGLYPIGFYPAYSTDGSGVWGSATLNTGTNWIFPLNSPVAKSGGYWHVSSKGNYTYRVLFNLPACTYTSLTLTGVHAEDDIAKFFLNGNQIIPGGGNAAGGFNVLTPFTYGPTSGMGFFKPGVNELLVKVENVISVTGLLVNATLQANSTCCIPPSGMVSWWKGDGNANDHWDGNHGTLQNGATFAAGKVGLAFSLNGVNQYVSVPNDPSLNFGPANKPGANFTIDAWIKADPSNQNIIIPIVDKRIVTGTNITGYTLFLYKGKLSLELADGTFYNYIPIIAPGLRDGNFHHVAVTVDRTKTNGIRFYVDGMPYGIPPTFNPTNRPGSLSNAAPLLIGAHATGLGFFKGLIDEVEIFNRALDQTEIQTIYNAGSAGKCKPNCIQPPLGMVAWWPGDGTANDFKDSNDGTLKNGATFAAGKVGQAFSLDGVSQYVEVPSPLSFNSPSLNFGTGDFSIDAWIKTTNTSGRMAIVEKMENGLDDGHGYTLYLNDGKLGFFMTNWSIGPPIALIEGDDTTQNLADGIWHHVAVTVHPTSNLNNNGQLFINGIPVGKLINIGNTWNVGTTTPDNNHPLRIGASDSFFSGETNFFKGSIDEVEIFNRSLTDKEVGDIFNAGSAGKCKPCVQPPSGMVAWWPLDETNGFNVMDILGTHNGGVIGTVGIKPLLFSGDITGGPVTIAPPMVNGHFYFLPSLTTGWVSVPPHPDFDFGTSGNFSIDAWVNKEGGNSAIDFLPIVDKNDSNAHKGYMFAVDGTDHLRFFLGAARYTSITTLTPEAWVHVAVTVDRSTGTVTLYINGTPETPAILAPGEDATSTVPLLIGGTYLDPSLRSTEYALDEIEIFNRTLSQTEIQSIYKARSAGKCR